MNKKYLIIIFGLVILFTSILITRKDTSAVYKLKERVSLISNTSEWINTKKAIEGLEAELLRNPENKTTELKLAQAYLQEGRVTGDHSYYDALAYSLIQKVLKREPENFEALCCKATLEASAHQFTDALNTSQQAITINPYNAYIYGVLCDANVELGNYKQAIAAADKMSSIRPDIRSYSRVSYLREIHGDYTGAIDAMKLALSAGVPGLEQTEWTRVYLGRLYETIGQVKEAEKWYKESISIRPNYAPALAALGNLAQQNGQYKEALVFYQNAAKTMTDYSYHQKTGEIYMALGKSDLAKENYEKALDVLIKHQHPTNEESGIGHNIDRELAQVFISMKEYEKAYESSKYEYNRRPNNIDVCETYAWACFLKGSKQEAQYYILKSLRTNSSNPVLLWKASTILSANNHPLVAQSYMRKASSINPGIAGIMQLQYANQNELAANYHEK
ncbi:hypothetical protein BH11BAC2_BH11BAC2_03180 [soil metagenome]